jgi:hypothetical protein
MHDDFIGDVSGGEGEAVVADAANRVREGSEAKRVSKEASSCA